MKKNSLTTLQEHLKAKRYSEAISLLFRLDADEMAPWINYYAIAECYRLAHDLPNAIYFMENAHTLQPDMPLIAYKLGILYALNLDDNEAISQFHMLLHQDKRYVPFYNRMGLLYARRGEVQRALLWYYRGLEELECLRREKISYSLWQDDRLESVLGFSFEWKEIEQEQDLAQLEQVIRNNIGVCYYEMGNYSRAKTWFKASIDSMPEGVVFPDPLVYMQALEKVG